jgi:hypothetical protein
MGALLDVEAAIAQLRESSQPLPSLTFGEVGYGYRPGRSLGFSGICHAVGVLAILFWGRYAFVYTPRLINIPIEVVHTDSVLYLPTFGGGSAGGGRAGGGSGQPGKMTSSLPARSRRGFAYRGPQPMVSDPPRATLGIQTILQPSLDHAQLLHKYLPLPNVVRPAVPPAPKPLVVKSQRLAIQHEQTVAAPKLTLPKSSSSGLAALTASVPAIPQKPAPPRAPDVSDVPTGMPAQDGLLVLNAVPPPPDVQTSIPRAEARSRFAVSPAEVTVIAEPAAGVKGGTSGASAGSGGRGDKSTGDTIAEAPSGSSGASHGMDASGTGSGGLHGTGHGSGLNATAIGSGTGRGNAAGTGAGTGVGASTGTGRGAGSAPGSGGFPGITIQGSHTGGAGIPSIRTTLGPRTPKSYNMTIVSTASSGGGLPDFGVFQNEKVYTVYLDMRDSDEDPAPSWTLQYSVLQPSAKPGDATSKIRGTPTPPLVSLKVIPPLDPDVLRKCVRHVIVASAIMDTNGKLEDVSVRDSPETRVTGPLIEALKNWIFEPALIDGRPVALKVLLGIRLTMPH